MNIGVITKWSIDPTRHPGLSRLAQNWNEPLPLSRLRESSTGNVGIQPKKETPKCGKCHGIKDISGLVCSVCQGGTAQGQMGAGEIDDPNDPILALSEPMEIAFRLLKELWQCDSCNRTFNDYKNYRGHECGVAEERWP